MDNKINLIRGKVRIFLVEDHEIFRMGLKELINQQNNLVVCGEADDANKAWIIIQENKPDMMIIDISLKESNGINLVMDIHKLYPAMPILVLSMHNESLYAERSLNAGARGYIMKAETSDSIILAIEQILKGNIYVSGKIIGKILNRVALHNDPIEKEPIDCLTNRELTVLQLIGEGSATGDIALKMNLSVKTVSTYKERIKKKLNQKNNTELVRYAIYWLGKI